jgi:hypothetical protein
MLSPNDPSRQSQLVPKPAAVFWQLLAIYLLFVVARFAVSLCVTNPLIPTDEIAYKNYALSFFRTGDFYRTGNLGYSNYIPNILYPFLISPSFFFREQFYIAIKLINSLVINTALIPSYLLAREFISHRKALLTAAAVLLLPSFHFVSFVAVDGLNLPLFLFCFLLCYRSSTRGGPNAPLAGLVMALLVLNKPSALAYLAGFVLATMVIVFYVMKSKDRRQLRIVLHSFATTTVSFLVSSVVLSFLLKHEVSYRLGAYGGLVGRPRAQVALSEVVDMALAYPFVLAATGCVCFFVCCAGFVDLLFRKQTLFEFRHAVLLVLGFSITLAYWAEVSKFMVDVYNEEHFDRLHTRYLFMICPLFVICFAVLVENLKWHAVHTALLFTFVAVVVCLNEAHFFPKYVNLGLNIFGSPDIGWAIHSADLLRPINYLSICGALAFYLFRRSKSAVPYLAFFVLLMLFANYGEIRNHVRLDRDNSENANYRFFVQSFIRDTNTSVAVVDEWLGHRLWLAFWLPYDYTATYDLPKGSVITRQMITSRTRYLVLFGEYQLEMPAHLVGRSGNCQILELE